MTNASDPADLFSAPLDTDSLQDFQQFSCGEEPWLADLREYLLEDALPQSHGRYNKTYLFYTPLQEPVGYLSLSAAQVNRADAGIRPRPPYPVVPAVLIGRLGIDSRYQGRGYGRQVIGLVREWARDLVVGCRVLALQVDVRTKVRSRFTPGWDLRWLLSRSRAICSGCSSTWVAATPYASARADSYRAEGA